MCHPFLCCFNPQVLSKSDRFTLGKLHVVMEFYPGGDLRQFLINSRADSPEEYLKSTLTSTLNHRQLLNIALDVANGMVHLSSQKV